jgi:hypothetical protein
MERHALVRDLGFLIVGLGDRKNLYCGAVVNMFDMLKGNHDEIKGLSLEGIFEAHMSMFEQPSSRKIVFSQGDTNTPTIPTKMMRGGSPLPTNHSKKR